MILTRLAKYVKLGYKSDWLKRKCYISKGYIAAFNYSRFCKKAVRQIKISLYEMKGTLISNICAH